jgi:hypothetical protein
VPPWASANRPLRAPTAPVNAPAAWPNSSASAAAIVQRARDQLLADAGLAEHEDGHRLACRHGDLGAHALHREAVTAQPGAIAARPLPRRDDRIDRDQQALADAHHGAVAQLGALDPHTVDPGAVAATRIANGPAIGLGVVNDLGMPPRYPVVVERKANTVPPADPQRVVAERDRRGELVPRREHRHQLPHPQRLAAGTGRNTRLRAPNGMATHRAAHPYTVPQTERPVSPCTIAGAPEIFPSRGAMRPNAGSM